MSRAALLTCAALAFVGYCYGRRSEREVWVRMIRKAAQPENG